MKTKKPEWWDRVRWIGIGAVVTAGAGYLAWASLTSFPKTSWKQQAPRPVSDSEWLKLRNRLELGDLTPRPSWLRGRIKFDHVPEYWLHCADAKPVVTAQLFGKFTDGELETSARYAAALAFLSFHNANRSLTLHLWNRRDLGGGLQRVRHCKIEFAVKLRPDGDATIYSVERQVTLFDSAFDTRS